ncbi:MAG: S-layer homology domain-containing protein, partial [Acutalibacter sp.]
MKKSKFLKKSLAMLLAVMLVVAMIPLSAAAADPVISRVTVTTGSTSEVAELSGDNTYTAEIPNPGSNSVTINVALADGNGKINRGTFNATQNEYTFTMDADEKEAKSAEFSVYDADNELVGTYTVTYTIAAESDDNSIESVSVPGMYDVTLEGSVYTVIVPYSMTGSQNVEIVLNNDKAHVDNNPAGQDKYTVTATVDSSTATPFSVTSESGKVANYSVKLVSAKAFTEFSVAGERKAADINRVTENYNVAKTVDIHMPYDTKADGNGSYKFTPTFTKAYESAEITFVDKSGEKQELVSGTEYDLGEMIALTANENLNDKTVNLTVEYSESKTETWTLSFDVPSQDPVAAIKGLSVANYAATIEGRNITLELPETIRKTITTIDLDTTSTVAVVGESIIPSNTSLTGIDLTKDSYILRATAKIPEAPATTPQVVDYTLTIKTAAAQTATMTNMTLEDKDGKQYEGKIDNAAGTITFEVPYSARVAADLEDWKLFWTASSGSTVTELDTTGSKLTGGEIFLPAGDAAKGFDKDHGTANTAIVVSTANLNSVSYKIVLTNAPANTAATISDVSLTSAIKFEDINDTNSVKASISGNTITIKVPYSQYTALRTGVLAGTLPEGAKLFIVDNSSTPTIHELDVLDEDFTGTPSNKLPAPGGTYPAYNNANTPATLLVTSEAISAEDGDSYNTVTAHTNAGKFKTYKLVVSQNDPRTTAEITSFGVYDAENKTTVKGSITGTDITITLPAYYADSDRQAADKLYLDFDVRGGESLTVGSDRLTDLLLKADGSVDSSSTKVTAHNGTANTDKKITFKPKPSSSDVDITTITVTPEDATKTSATYTLTVKFADAGTEAKLNSVTINGVTGTPDANNKVTINLPFGAEVTSLVPTFNVAANGYVVVPGTMTTPSEIPAGASYNFISDKKFTVYAENGVNSATYTISVTTADQFSDVDTNDWYYSNVMRAVELGILSGYSDGTFKPMN